MNDRMLTGAAARAELLADDAEQLSRDLQRTLAAGETAFAAGKAALDACMQFWATIRPLALWLAAWLDEEGTTATPRTAPQRAVSA